jgi:hypothetical protein
MLRIVTELDYIKISIGAAHQMTLRPTPHASHVLNRNYRQPSAFCPRMRVSLFRF